MSTIGIDVRARTASGHPECEVALVAEDGAEESIAAILNRHGHNVSAFTDVHSLLGCSPSRGVGLIVMWVDDATSGLVVKVESLMRSRPQTPLVVVCSGIESRGVRAALAGGAAGVVLSQDLESALGPCIQAVLAGQTCVPRGHWRQIDPPALSSREKQILGLVVMGYMNSQIAKQLFLAESTVKSHLSSAFGKLGVRSRNEAVSLILNPERGLGMGILALVGEGESPGPTPAAVR
jgi:DNA-binding NarL/FixJ family response regulator